MNDEREATFNRLLDKLMTWKQVYAPTMGRLIPLETVERILAEGLLTERRSSSVENMQPGRREGAE